MNYFKWQSCFIVALWFSNIVARFISPTDAYLKICAGDAVTLLCIIALNVVWLREKK